MALNDIGIAEDPMAAFCRLVVQTGYEDLPDNVIRYARDTIIDTLAVTIGGSGMDGISAVVSLVKEKGGKPESLLPFYGGRVPASEAALAIGPMSRAMDYGDIHKKANHCGEYVLPALLAATGLKEKVSGREFITAFALGCEVLIRTGIAYNNGLSLDRVGGHFIFGCVAAVGKLINLNLVELENAQGIACEMTQPHTMAMFRPVSTLMIRVHHGFVCQDAINACLLARRGITGPHYGVLAAPLGYLGFAAGQADTAALLDKLGTRWDFLGLTQKHYPSVAFSQNPIDTILEQMRQYKFGAVDIGFIEIQMAGAPREIRPKLETEQDCQFNLPYLVSTAAFDGDISLDSYEAQARKRPEVLDLMNRVTIKSIEGLKEMGIVMNTTLKNGAKYTTESPYPKGDPNNPLTAADLDHKFNNCARYSAYKLSDDSIRAIIDTLHHLEQENDVANALMRPLTPGD